MAKRILSAMSLLFAATAAMAQDEHPSVINLADSASVYQALYANTPIEPEFMLVPKFAIVGRENKFVFSTGASLKFTTCYDWGNPVRDPNGMGVSSITQAWGADRRLLQMSAGGSGIFFNIIGFPNTQKQVGLFISIGVDADGNNTYRLSAGQVYMRYRDFQCGYATSLYNDKASTAYSIDAHGAMASGDHNNVGINYQRSISKHLRVGIGLESPNVSYTQVIPNEHLAENLSVPSTSPQSVPDIPMYVGYAWGAGHVRLSSVIRNIRTTNYLNGESENHSGWGLKLSSKVDLSALSFYFTAQGGRSIASYFKDDAGIGLDLVPQDDESSQLTATHSWGLISSVQYRFTPKVFANAQLSYMRNYIPQYESTATTSYDHQMRYGFSYFANVVWKMSSLLSLGMEYRHGHRTDETHQSLSNNRIYAMLLMSF